MLTSKPAMDFVNISARGAITSRIVILIEQIDNVIQLDHCWRLETQLNQMKKLLFDISHQFQHHQQRAAVETVTNCLERMEDRVRRARLLIHRSQGLQQCFSGLFSKPKLSGQIFDWKTNVNKLFKELQIGLAELQTHLVETGIKHGEEVVQCWLREAPHVHIIGICGCAGVGKTRLLQNVYNTYKVSDVFDVIWVTVGQLGTLELQDCIARAINLDLRVHDSNNEMSKYMRKRKLSKCLKTKKFLLIFDDLWSPLDLNKLGVAFDNDRGSKIICSTRTRYVIEAMGTKNCICIQPLTRMEAWQLFHSVAFKDGHLPPDLEHIARKVADECKGLPLAINVTAATMRGNNSVNKWNLALRQMQTPIDHIFPTSCIRMDAHLYQVLRWNYETLPDANLKSCFMYCAMFLRDEEIEVDKIVGMWIGEGLVKSMDTAHSYIKLLVDRCFFQVTHIPNGILLVKTHSTLRDVAIYTGKREEHCLFMAGLGLQNFPMEIAMNDWKRISFYGNSFKSLPAEGLKCRNLVSLNLGANKELEEVPMSFLDHLPSIRVLDLSRTKIKLLPKTLWQLKQLEYLDVSYTQIEELSEEIGHLSKLQVLNMSGCSKLKSLPPAIGYLSGLQFLNVSGCSRVTSIPSEIFELKILKYFNISQYNFSL